MKAGGFVVTGDDTATTVTAGGGSDAASAQDGHMPAAIATSKNPNVVTNTQSRIDPS
ncbi:hypothetical protein MPLDJ20_70154 [Mesorhizobium plurifarium]|uniref:Uncharacterized protein n=1 Tax=Mesorhizobium plurifarium TaxID=69974 RepID=A0A090FN56_MESPL|nr:hypothetical protein MPLDJ20_70154 [Mesorhizobium plurifarium]CDX54055.1 hypothetical protein MPL1032_180332 [Mesorhizobium plurifarium]